MFDRLLTVFRFTLDTKTSQDVMNLLAELNEQGITIVIVTHKLDIAAQTNRMIRIQDGNVINPADCLTSAV